MTSNDGVVDHVLYHLAISAKPADIPNEIAVDISGAADRRRHPGRRPRPARRRHHRRRPRGAHRHRVGGQVADLGEPEPRARRSRAKRASRARPPRRGRRPPTPVAAEGRRAVRRRRVVVRRLGGRRARQPRARVPPHAPQQRGRRRGPAGRAPRRLRARDGRIKVLADTVRVGQHRVVVGFPQTYYNESGLAVGAWLRRHDLGRPASCRPRRAGPPARSHQGEGRRRPRRQQGPGVDPGPRRHRRLRRVRIGVGKPPGRQQGADHVLRPRV